MPFDIARVRKALPGRRIEFHDTLPSTQPVAVKLAEAGAPSGTAVVAAQQTAGIGRQGHSWHSEAESGLYVSLILYPPIEPATRPILTLALGLATAEAIARVTGLQCDLRWPNDIMIDDRKTAGILVQLAGDAAVAGIGINVNHESFPPDIASTATSIRLATGHRYDRADLLIALLESAEAYNNMLKEAGKHAVIDAFIRASSYAKGKRVQVDMGDRVIEGITAGLDDYGFLRVLKPDGVLETILAGGVRPA
ncbi:MAG TPA: biotin--[acetyl-CoA-carboxylase] ligase [Bryobacteraceae bacterium]|jgi:BirA family biotin operon repressor/biotin-[acetyl-CoA-carboxylase] ligase